MRNVIIDVLSLQLICLLFFNNGEVRAAVGCTETNNCLKSQEEILPTQAMTLCRTPTWERWSEMVVMVTSIRTTVKACNANLDKSVNCTEGELRQMDNTTAAILEYIASHLGYCGQDCTDMDVQQKMVEIPQCVNGINSSCTSIQTGLDCIQTIVGACKAPFLFNVSTVYLMEVATLYDGRCPNLEYGGKPLQDHLQHCDTLAFQAIECMSNVSDSIKKDRWEMMTATNVQDVCGDAENLEAALFLADECLSDLKQRCPATKDMGEKERDDYALFWPMWSLVKLHKAACFTECSATETAKILNGYDKCLVFEEHEHVFMTNYLSGYPPTVTECSVALVFKECYQAMFHVCKAMESAFDDVVIIYPDMRVVTLTDLMNINSKCNDPTTGKGAVLRPHYLTMVLASAGCILLTLLKLRPN